MSKNYLSRYDELHKGDYLISNNQQFKAVFQEDGNFVVYGWKPIWASNTVSSDAHRLCMQNDSNLVMYTEHDKAVWATNSCKPCCKMVRLTLKDDGTLVVTRGGVEVWSSA